MKGKDKSGNVIEINLGNSPAYNPAFDITPKEYVTKIICEKGVFDTGEIKDIINP